MGLWCLGEQSLPDLFIRTDIYRGAYLTLGFPRIRCHTKVVDYRQQCRAESRRFVLYDSDGALRQTVHWWSIGQTMRYLKAPRSMVKLTLPQKEWAGAVGRYVKRCQSLSKIDKSKYVFNLSHLCGPTIQILSPHSMNSISLSDPVLCLGYILTASSPLMLSCRWEPSI